MIIIIIIIIIIIKSTENVFPFDCVMNGLL